MPELLQKIKAMLYHKIRKIGLPNFQSLYVKAIPFTFPWCGKSGVSINGQARAEQIQCSIKEVMGLDVWVFTMVKMPVLFPYHCEKIVHWILDRLWWRTDALRGTTGWTEYFRGVNVLCFAILFYLFAKYHVEAPFYKAIFVCLFPLPLDHCLLVIGIALCQYAAIILTFYLLIKSVL